jgi:hypothetical protein
LPPSPSQHHRRSNGEKTWWAPRTPRSEPPARGLLWLNFWGSGLQRHPDAVEYFCTGGGDLTWSLRSGQYINQSCTPYIFVGYHTTIDTATGHIYYPIRVNGTWLNAKTLNRLPEHLIGDDAEMEHFVMPPPEVYMQWDERVRLNDAATAPVIATDTHADHVPVLQRMLDKLQLAQDTCSDDDSRDDDTGSDDDDTFYYYGEDDEDGTDGEDGVNFLELHVSAAP